ncbi:MAG: tetratricopeptide repeat protein [Gammaproteobacteria bacterium]
MSKKNILIKSKKKKALALISANELVQARAVLDNMLRTERADPEVWFMAGVIAGKERRLQESIECLRRVIQLDPRHVMAHYNLGLSLRDLGDYAAAIDAFSSTVALQPDLQTGWDCLAHAQMQAGELEAARTTFQQALSLNPSNAELLSNYGSLLLALGLSVEAIEVYQAALRLAPALAGAHDGLGTALCMQGRFAEAIAATREGLKYTPGRLNGWSNLLLTLNYLPELDNASLADEHRTWGERFGDPPGKYLHHRNPKNPGRRLRVGYVSPDFRTHSVAFFAEPLLSAHDPEQVEIYCYATSPKEDEYTRRFRSIASGWRDISCMPDREAAEQVIADGIDILVDLAGHTSGTRLSLFALKPAPVQISWLGYPNTTGLKAIDCRITDTFADPADQDPYYVEKLTRVEGCFLCFKPMPDAPAPQALPALREGSVTFGSFNNYAKMNPVVVAAWCGILRRVEGARLLVKNPSLSDPAVRELLLDMIRSQGIEVERIELLGHTKNQREHLALYQRVDIALDTFPYNGTTTTCEALWMGVPVVGLAGERHAGRVGVSLMHAIGRGQWVAESIEAYTDIAVSLSADLAALERERQDLRTRMEQSPLCDGKAFAKKIEAVYRQCWIDWCASAESPPAPAGLSEYQRPGSGE